MVQLKDVIIYHNKLKTSILISIKCNEYLLNPISALSDFLLGIFEHVRYEICNEHIITRTIGNAKQRCEVSSVSCKKLN